MNQGWLWFDRHSW